MSLDPQHHVCKGVIYVSICCELLFAVHAILSEAFSEGVGVDLQLCDLKTTKNKAVGLPSLDFCFWFFVSFAFNLLFCSDEYYCLRYWRIEIFLNLELHSLQLIFSPFLYINVV